MAEPANASQRASSSSSSPTSIRKQPQQQQSPAADDANLFPIPPLSCVAAAIFVPIPPDTDLLSAPSNNPLPAPPSSSSSSSSSSDRQRAALAALNAHEAQARVNLQNLFRRESLRLIREAEVQELTFKYYPDADAAAAAANHQHRSDLEAAERHDLLAMIANMAAPIPRPDGTAGPQGGDAAAAADANDAFDIPNSDIPVPNFNDVPVSSLREWVANELMKNISFGLVNLNGFDKHVDSMRDAILRKDRDNDNNDGGGNSSNNSVIMAD